jgi:TPR repeat protein
MLTDVALLEKERFALATADIYDLCDVGIRYFEGIGTKPNRVKGYKYIALAAKNGIEHAMQYIGFHLAFKQKPRPRKALYYLKKSFRYYLKTKDIEGIQKVAYNISNVYYTCYLDLENALYWCLIAKKHKHFHAFRFEGQLLEMMKAKYIEKDENGDYTCYF